MEPHVGYHLGGDLADGAERFNAKPVAEEDRVCRRIEVGGSRIGPAALSAA